ncbi:MAG: NERD domain-containing protein [Gammaproteobacteria bacterium]|nr:NERD domain-containing protein [Gammaproteobacteria bacterium]
MTPFFNNPLFILISFVFGMVLIVYINRFKLKQLIHNWQTARCLDRLGLDQITNLSCPDGLGSNFKIDRLILLDHAILIVNYKKYPGKIFGSKNIDEWTQMLGQKSYKFKNPLFNLKLQLHSLNKCIPEVTIEACLFFDNSAQFPKSIPPQVLHPTHIDERFFRKNLHQVKPDVMRGWKTLKSLKENIAANEK